MVGLMIVELGDSANKYAIYAEDVVEVITSWTSHKIPLQHRFVDGLFRFRGYPLPLINTFKVLNIDSDIGLVAVLDTSKTAKKRVGLAISRAADILEEYTIVEKPLEINNRFIKHFISSDRLGTIAQLDVEYLFDYISKNQKN